VVDDHDDARELIRHVLEARGVHVTTATSTGEALHLLERERFDVLISDIGMPDEDGLSLIRAIRNLPHMPAHTIPAIAVTAYATLRERDEALDAGYDSHLAKPVEPDQLIAAVAAVSAARP
jgi:CheY-like chemotaxis protein